MSHLDHPAVRRVQAALREKGSRAEVIELGTTARTAEDAARSLGVAVGAIVKSLVFTIDGDPVMALVAGDRRCDTRALAPAAWRRSLTRRRCRPRSTTASAGSKPSTPPPATRSASSRRPCSSSAC